jgi:HAD superfamily hydrolase (TIGR01509 family)
MFDSGGVLTQPAGGRWNPRHDFEAILLSWVPAAPAHLFPAAFAAGDRYLESSNSTPTRSDYHRVLLEHLGIKDAPEDLLQHLEAPAAGPPLELYPDVVPALDRLRRQGIPMCVVSDNWASLTGIYDQLGITHYFEAVVISEVLGCTKPDPRMYAAGRQSMGLQPQNCLFVDDDPDLVAAAATLKYRAITLDRNAGGHRTPAGVVSSLDDVVAIVEQSAVGLGST